MIDHARMCWILPIKTVSEMNSSEHWTKKSKRHKQQQFFVRQMFKRDTVQISIPCHVRLTRLAPRMLDCDNLPPSLKYVKDEVAGYINPHKEGFYKTKTGKWIAKKGHADNDPNITWSYHQEKWPKQAVKIEIVEKKTDI